MNEIIVYNQKDLDKALSEKKKNIVLCAGLFLIPKSPGVTFSRLGPVHAVIMCSRAAAEEADMKFINIDAEFKTGYAVSDIAGHSPVAATLRSFFTSGSKKTGSGGSYAYTYEYEFEYERSFKGSFSTSFLYSFKTSFNSSFYGSFTCSFPISGSFKLTPSKELAVVRVFGYGIDLI